MDDKERLRKVKGLVFFNGDKIVNTGLRPSIGNLDTLPFPARHLVPYRKYTSLLSRGNVVTTMITSRGCPFGCKFCDRPHLGKLFRARSASNVVDEIEACVKMGINEFLIYDDTFTVNHKRVVDICDKIIARNLNIGFDIRTRVDTDSDQMLARLKTAGCRGIHYGVEAGTEKTIRVLNKGINLNQVKEAFTLTRKHGIPILAYFMIGNPGERIEDIETTFKVIRWLDPDYLHMTILTPFPGTEIYHEAFRRHIIQADVWKKFARNPYPEFIPPHWGEFFTRDQLKEILIRGYKEFYLKPRHILRMLRRLRSWDEFKKKARAGLSLFYMK